MTQFLLDTNAVIGVLQDKTSLIAQRIRQHPPTAIAISSIVAHELWYGAFKSQRVEHNVSLVDNLYFQVLEFDKEDARQAGEIRAALAKSGTHVGPYDVLIAGQAMARDSILITHNIREFSRVPGLRVEDWQV